MKALYLKILYWLLLTYLRAKRAKQQHEFISERLAEYHEVLKFLLLHPEIKTILDVGTGRSAFPALLQDMGYKVDCIDSKGDPWHSFNHHIELKKANILITPIQKQYDLVLCISTLEHIWHWPIAIERMSEIVNPGGYLIISVPSGKESIDNVSNKGLTKQFGQYGRELTNMVTGKVISLHYRCFTSQTWGNGRRIHPQQIYNDKGNLLIAIIEKP
jgi:2-polyprenyl-3-methyl-5-hydroxy-6-metoxy-1,4-benzoquinol methylase